ncbi:MAG: HipA N-terminal domain-containing protein [Deltaproteobacteria bacterium]|nr:HipA N-terminal domain-containing protein [Deltaproteobacteria bacterium]
MRKAKVFMHDIHAGILEEITPHRAYVFTYLPEYKGPPVSLTVPVRQEAYEYDTFPAFLEGLLPEGYNLEGLLRALKIDRQDLFSQLLAVGNDMVGAVTVQETE